MNALDAILILGDISYANSDHTIWDDWFTMMDEFGFLQNKPMYITSGNHDAEGNLDFGQLFTAFEIRFLIAPTILDRVSNPYTLYNSIYIIFNNNK